MTAAEFKIAFETRFYAATTVNSLGWSDDEISEFLNYAQNTIVKTAIDSGNLKAISNLVKVATIAEASSTVTSNERRFPTAVSGFYELVDAELVISGNNYPMEKIMVDNISDFKVTPYNAALFRQPKVAVDYSLGDSITFVVLQGGYVEGVPSALNYRYAVKPTTIDIKSNPNRTTNLNEKLHDSIVDLAVQKAVETFIKTGQSTQ